MKFKYYYLLGGVVIFFMWFGFFLTLDNATGGWIGLFKHTLITLSLFIVMISLISLYQLEIMFEELKRGLENADYKN